MHGTYIKITVFGVSCCTYAETNRILCKVPLCDAQFLTRTTVQRVMAHGRRTTPVLIMTQRRRYYQEKSTTEDGEIFVATAFVTDRNSTFRLRTQYPDRVR